MADTMPVKEKRDETLAKYDEVYKAYNTEKARNNWDAAMEYRDQYRQLVQEYSDLLPRIPLSCCPYDLRPLVCAFDPFGFDGLWWEPSAVVEDPKPCSHFCCLTGAVNYTGQPRKGGSFEVRPGPEVPYVVPRLLDYEGMVAVISQVRMDPGYIAYPIAYFAYQPPPPAELTVGWRRETYEYPGGWKSGEADLWNFDLRPYVQAGKIYWCPPDSDNTILNTDPSVPCPYVDLPGERQRIAIQGDKSWKIGLPDGQPTFPLD